MSNENSSGNTNDPNRTTEAPKGQQSQGQAGKSGAQQGGSDQKSGQQQGGQQKDSGMKQVHSANVADEPKKTGEAALRTGSPK
jgi:hypothetical protein